MDWLKVLSVVRSQCQLAAPCTVNHRRQHTASRIRSESVIHRPIKYSGYELRYEIRGASTLLPKTAKTRGLTAEPRLLRATINRVVSLDRSLEHKPVMQSDAL